jgi:DNA-binding NarL/FixJ family response regulator
MPDGGSTRSLSEHFQDLLARGDAARKRTVDCARIWRGLVTGRLRVADSRSTPTHAYLLLEPKLFDGRRGRPPHRFDVLERVLLGAGQKVASIELGLSPSTVALLSKRALRSIGVQNLPSRTPAVLFMLAKAARSPRRAERVRRSELAIAEKRYLLLSVPLETDLFANVLTPSEHAVVLLRLAGKSHAEIAAERGIARRTVANQLAGAFHRLGISGRFSLLDYVLHGSPGAVPAKQPHRRVRSRA